MSESFRAYDMQLEGLVGEFLDAHLYPKFCVKHRRARGRTEQLEGIDMVASFAGGASLIIDEKTALNYVTTDLSKKALPTFAFEVSFMNNGRELPGWLFDPEKATDHYLLSWLWTGSRKWSSPKEIRRAECYLIPRQSIIDFLTKQGIDAKTLPAINKAIRKTGVHGPHRKGTYEGFYFYLSLTNYEKKPLPEQPVNIVVQRSVLSSMAIRKFGVGEKAQY